jgi:hypothetical protein
LCCEVNALCDFLHGLLENLTGSNCLAAGCTEYTFYPLMFISDAYQEADFVAAISFLLELTEIL